MRERPLILSVNDDVASAYLVAHVLERAGFEVQTVSTASEAQERAALLPDAMIVDVQLPDFDGFELCRRIKRAPATSKIPVVHLSAYRVESTDRAHGLDGGADAYVVQPFDPDELLAVVRSVLRNRGALDHALEASRAWQATLDAMGDAVCFVALDGRITRCNRRFAALLGREVEGTLGRSHAELTRALLRETPLAAPLQPRSPERRQVELELGGQWFRVSEDPVLADDGRVAGRVQVFADVTETKRAAQALALADRRKNDFLAMLGHELRNPLNGISFALHALRLRADDSQRRGHYLDVIGRQAGHLGRLLDDLLDVARITRNKIELRPEVVPLAALVEQALEANEAIVAERAHQLKVVDDEAGARVQVDPARGVQILSNLITNAAKYTPRGGEIRVRLSVGEKLARVEVEDTGIGIEPEHLDDVFELFVQLEPGLARSSSGLGIGLSVARRLAQLHGGSLTVKSPGIGQGSTFTLSLPRAQAGEAPGPLKPFTSAPEVAAAPRRMVYVEDHDDTRTSTVELLESWGFEVHAAASGEEGMALIAQVEPELVLMDIGLPGMDGCQLAERIRAAWGKGPRLIALSGYGTELERRRALGHGFDEHLVKPVSITELARALGVTLEQRAG